MHSEHKTQIYLSRRDYRALRARARAERRSMAALMREALAAYLSRDRHSRQWDADPIGGIVGAAPGDASASRSVDEQLYGDAP